MVIVVVVVVVAVVVVVVPMIYHFQSPEDMCVFIDAFLLQCLFHVMLY